MKQKNGYFTVEAALVLPMAMAAIFFAVYILLLQYNRCLLEQDMGILAVWGSLISGEEEEIALELKNGAENIYWEKYLVWETTKFDVMIQNNECWATSSGRVEFPLPGWNFWNDENVWNVEAEWNCPRFHPVEFVRMCNKFKSKGE